MSRTFTTALTLLTLLWTAPASAQQLPGGYTCEQVKKMSETKRSFLIWVFGLTEADVERIKRRCKIK